MSSRLAKKIVPGPVRESLIGSTIVDQEMVSAMIKKTMPQVEVLEIKTVKNSFIEGMYLLKKEEYKSRYKKMPKEKLLFHVTAASNVKSIITDNFDWRRTSRGKFGLGTSFSGDASYANHYANYNIGEERAIIVTKILVSKTTEGKYGMRIPHKKCDTTTGNGGKVFVKFNDNEILPCYVVFYKSNLSQTNKKNKKKPSKNKQHSHVKPPIATTSKGGTHYYDDYEENQYDSEQYGDYEEEDYFEDEYDEACEEEEEWEDENEYYDDEYGEEEEEYEEGEEEEEYEEGEEEEEYEECEDEYEEEEEEYEEEEEECEEEEEECEEEEEDYDEDEYNEDDYGDDYYY